MRRVTRECECLEGYESRLMGMNSVLCEFDGIPESTKVDIITTPVYLFRSAEYRRFFHALANLSRLAAMLTCLRELSGKGSGFVKWLSQPWGSRLPVLG